MNVHVVVPVRDHSYLTRQILAELDAQDGWTFAHFYDNGSVDNTPEILAEAGDRDPRILVADASGVGIYEMWEAGLNASTAAGADRVLFINNDVTLAPGLVGLLAAAVGETVWLAYPNYDRPLTEGTADLGTRETFGTYRHGGMSGFCFMALAERLDWRPLVDPALRWWGGDDEIAFEVEKRGGRQVRVEGVGIQHDMEGTARHHDLEAQKAADLSYITAKWGR